MLCVPCLCRAQDVLVTLLNNLKVQERQNRVCTTVAIAIVAETCSPFTVLPALMNEYKVRPHVASSCPALGGPRASAAALTVSTTIPTAKVLSRGQVSCRHIPVWCMPLVARSAMLCKAPFTCCVVFLITEG